MTDEKRNKKNLNRLFTILMVGAMVFPLIFCTTAAASSKPLVYIVNSYNPATFGWTQEIVDGFTKGLAQKGMVKNIHYTTATMNIDAFVNSSEAALEKVAGEILADIKAKQPALILTTDDDALHWVGLKIKNIPVVFNGVNGNPSHYLESPLLNSMDKPGHNVTGVYQTSYFKQSLDFLLKVKPDAKTYAVITDETTTGHALFDQFMEIKSTFLLTMKDKLISKDFGAWKEKIKSWQGNVDFMFLLSANAVNDGGKTIGQGEVGAWIAENSMIPDTCPWGFQVQSGILMAATDSGEQQGVYSADMAADILSGKAKPGEIAITTPEFGVPALNGTRAGKMNLDMPQDLLDAFVNSGQIFE